MKFFCFLCLVGITISCGKESDNPGRFVETRPADGATEVDVDNHIIIVFTEAVADATVKGQAEDGACTGEPIEVSRDGFVTCLGGTASVVPESDRHKVDWGPAHPLEPSTSYQIRINKMEFDTFKPLAAAVTAGFTTSATVSDGQRSPDNK